MGDKIRKHARYRHIVGVIPLSLLFLYLHLSSCMVFCSERYCSDYRSEKYFIDGQNVFLLYKIVNWWYDCQPKENHLLCGKPIKCINLGNACIEYTQSKSALKVSIQKGLATQLSIFKTCSQCFGPSYLRCIWQNEKYLGNGRAAPSKNVNQFSFFQIDKIQARILKNMEKEIVFIVQGNIRGLMNNGKIALHDTGTILKRCPSDAQNAGGIVPITVKIKNNGTNEIIAEYLGTWSN